ncbi:MAG: metal ABC transporter substrate-binding protein [Oscillospiraceae bacterium]|nr:metal ABC transporter substrate-binding protein [Oscillospiraceae bacterium]
MKKAISLAAAALLCAVALFGCGTAGVPQTTGGSAAPKKISVVATIFPPYDFVREIAGDLVDLKMLLPPAAESHSFEPTPRDMVDIQNCDLFIYVGGESDEWVEGVLGAAQAPGRTVVTLMDCVAVVEEEIVEGMEEEEEEEEGGEAPEYDEHVWTAPQNAKLIVEKLSAALCALDEANAAAYQQNTSAYLLKLDALDAQFRAVTQAAKRKTIVFGDRFPFRYFADAYGLDYFAAFPGCSTETECSAKTLAFLIDKVKAEQLPVVFHIELSNAKIANTIAQATGAQVRLLHAVHNISGDDFDAGASYLSLMEKNVETLKEALG